MTAYSAKVNSQGRVVLPMALRAAAGIKPGDDVVMEASTGEIRIRTVETAVTRVQAKYRKLAAGRDIVGELLAERREEAEK